MGCLCLQIDSICLDHTVAFRNIVCSVDHIQSKLPKQYFSTIFGHVVTTPFDLWVLPIFPHVVTLTFDPQIKENASNPFLIEKSYFLVYLNGVVTLKQRFSPYLVMKKAWPLTFGPEIFRHAQNCPNKSFLIIKNVPIWCSIFECSCGSKMVFLPIHVFVHVVTFTFGFQTFRNA